MLNLEELNNLHDFTYEQGRNYLLALNFSQSCVNWVQEDNSRPHNWSASTRFYSPDRTITIKFYTSVCIYGRRPSDSDLLRGNWRGYLTPFLSENPGERPS